MIELLKARRLRRGDVIGICAPASAPADGEQLERGIRYLERLGYLIEPGKHLHRRDGYLAGTDEQRAADLNGLFANRHVRAIIAARGGYGSIRLLPLLRYAEIRRHPKILVGYSDITALQLALFRKCGLVTFSGPMVASDFGRKFSGTAEEMFWRTMTSPAIPRPIRAGASGLRVKSGSGRARGRILGGNLSLVASMIGTAYMPLPPSMLLYLEEIDERPYRVDRILHQFQLAGVLRRTTGVVLGQFIDCAPTGNRPSLTLRRVFEEMFGDVPVGSRFRFGHIANPHTLPLGIRAEIDPSRGILRFLETAVAG